MEIHVILYSIASFPIIFGIPSEFKGHAHHSIALHLSELFSEKALEFTSEFKSRTYHIKALHLSELFSEKASESILPINLGDMHIIL